MEELKHFWRKDCSDFIADIGTCKQAVVVAFYIGGYYKISNRSYFFFPESYYHKKFDTPYEAIELAEAHVKDFVKSLFILPDAKCIETAEALRVCLELGYPEKN